MTIERTIRLAGREVHSPFAILVNHLTAMDLSAIARVVQEWLRPSPFINECDHKVVRRIFKL